MPVRFSQELFADICEHIADGKTLREIEKLDGMPTARAITKWLNQDETGTLVPQYVRAKERQAEKMADEILDIADEKQVDAVYDGEQVTLKLDSTAVQRNRLRVDTRKWLMSKMLPKKYGDKLAVDANVNVNLAAELAALNAAK